MKNKLFLPAKDAENLIVKLPPQYDTFFIHAEKLVIKDNELEITVDWQQLKTLKRLVFFVGDDKLTFEKSEQEQ